jgi:pimeloyl-ACP methyl ester carboxylesterase
VPVWLKAHQEWVRKVPDAKHVVTDRSGHGIVLQEPELVVEAIREMGERVREKTRDVR